MKRTMVGSCGGGRWETHKCESKVTGVLKFGETSNYRMSLEPRSNRARALGSHLDVMYRRTRFRSTWPRS